MLISVVRGLCEGREGKGWVVSYFFGHHLLLLCKGVEAGFLVAVAFLNEGVKNKHFREGWVLKEGWHVCRGGRGVTSNTQGICCSIMTRAEIA